MKKIILILAIIGFSLLFLAVAGTFTILYFTVSKTCNLAKEKHGGNCQTALVKILEDEKASPKEKNDAIWALGQMADPSSCPALEKIYAGKVPEGREPLNEVVSQYEVEKAIRWTKNGNWTSWIYGCLKK